MLPELARDLVVQACEEFDRERRGKPHDGQWEDDESRDFVIEHRGAAYPAKTIVSLASGTAVSRFTWREARDQLGALGFPIRAVRGRAPRAVHVWWVNQGEAFARERAGGYVATPKTHQAGADRGAHRRLAELRRGDITLHYVDRALVAIGQVTHDAVEVTSEPARGTPRKPRGKRTAREPTGWRAEVAYTLLAERAIGLPRITEMFRDFALEDGPFQADHEPKHGYLWRFSLAGLRRLRDEIGAPWPAWADASEPIIAADRDEAASPSFALERAVKLAGEAIAARGARFEPWQVAAYITALRTKPFVILAGVSGTGKSRLPREVATVTGCSQQTIPVRPDWTDSSDVIGYIDLQGAFRPGKLLLAAERAAQAPDQLHVVVLDEMNLARVEHYLAEVLSRIERRTVLADGSIDSEPLADVAEPRWASLTLPSNLAIVGTVNMDDSTHPFSRKVLDRAFTLELSGIDLARRAPATGEASALVWPMLAWQAADSLAARLQQPAAAVRDAEIINELQRINEILQYAQLEIAFRTRDEIVAFVLNAEPIAAQFVTQQGEPVDPLDLALMMKILPRIAGGTGPVREVVGELLVFAHDHALPPVDRIESRAVDIGKAWRARRRPVAMADARYPRTAARLCLMWQRLLAEGFTSFWV